MEEEKFLSQTAGQKQLPSMSPTAQEDCDPMLPIPPPESLALGAMRRSRGLSSEEFAALAGLSSRMMTKYEKRQAPSPEILAELAALLGYSPEDVAFLLLALREPPPLPGGGTPVDPTPTERQTLYRAALQLTLAVAGVAEGAFLDRLRDHHARTARRAAGRVWRHLHAATPAQRRLLVEKTREAQTWAVAERLCAESVKAAANDADLAQELTTLARRAAELAPAEEPWRWALQGYVLAFFGNARRVGGDLRGADKAFEEAGWLWEAGIVAGPGPLAGWRMPDLEAALRSAQHDWSRALDLHSRALAGAPPQAAGRILLNQSATLVLMGETQRATETLREASFRIDPLREPRHYFNLQFNLAANLCRSEQFAEGERLLPEVRELAVGLGNALDLIRVLWVQGKAHAGLGRSAEATMAFEQVLQEFTDRKIPYDAALVALELSVLYLEQGRAAEVQVVALGLAWIFTAEGVDEETAKALALFYDAAIQKAATVDFARRLVRYFDRACLQPGLPFEA